jgi:hypothetical protein
MKSLVLALAIAGTAVVAAAPSPSKTYTGVVSDSMCGINHTPMGISPDPKCIVECVKHGTDVKYVLVIDARTMYTLSDQQTPAQYAGQRVRVTGVLYPKTNILKVERIEK